MLKLKYLVVRDHSREHHRRITRGQKNQKSKKKTEKSKIKKNLEKTEQNPKKIFFDLDVTFNTSQCKQFLII